MKNKLNILYFCLYLIERQMHLIFNKMNVFLLLYKIPVIKRRMKNQFGIDNPIEYYNDFFLNKKRGFSHYFIFGAFYGITLAVFITLIIMVNKTFQFNISFEKSYLIGIGIINYVFCHYIIFKNEIYLEYFEKFEKWSLSKKRINVSLSIVFVVLVFVSLILSINF